jgi:hypothetical protein
MEQPHLINEPLEIAPKPDYNVIPVQLNEPEFAQFILPHLSLPKRGPRCKIGYHKPFNYILKVLYGGMQWKELPIDKGADGLAEIHYTGVFKLFARWCEDGSLEHAFIASVRHLDEHKKLDLSVLQGDGSNTVAKEARALATAVTSTKRVKRSSRLPISVATFSPPSPWRLLTRRIGCYCPRG